MGELDARLPPELRWIAALCSSSYFQPCERHEPAGGKEKDKGELTNFFARDTGETLCPSCVGGRDVVQIRRSSYHNVVRVRDVCRLFDARNIQTYVINGARVVFLNERPHPRGKQNQNQDASQTVDKKTHGAKTDAAGARRPSCRKCSRTLQSDTSRYCSIACKAGVAGIEMEPSEEAAREAEAEAGPGADASKTKSGEKSEKRQKRKKREVEDVDAERGFENGSPRTPSALGSARGGRGVQAERPGSNGSFGSVRGAKREPIAGDDAKPFFSLGDETVEVGLSRSDKSASFPLDSPFANQPGKRAKREKAGSPLGFPDLDTEDGGGSGEERARGGGQPFSGFRKKEKKEKKEKELEKPPAVISNSRRKNRPKRSPDA